VRRHKCHRSSFVFSADWFLHFGSVLFRRQTQQPNSAQYDGNCITGGILMLRLSHYKGHLFRPSGPQRCSYSPVSQPGQRASTSWLAACSPRLCGPSQVLCVMYLVMGVECQCDVLRPRHTLSHIGCCITTPQSQWPGMALTVAPKPLSSNCATRAQQTEKESKSGRCGSVCCAATSLFPTAAASGTEPHGGYVG